MVSVADAPFPFAAVAVLALLLPSAAHAAFPGANGEIAFSRDDGGGENVWANARGRGTSDLERW